MLFPHPAFWGRLALAFACALGLSTSTHAAGLNDTGITECWNDTGVVTTGVESDTGSHPRQDCRYGRDAAADAGMPKIGGGGKGFDFSKIANDGSVLPGTAELGTGSKDWACTRDNVTGLIWEVKTTSGPRNLMDLYTWYNSDAATNGGRAGWANGGACSVAGRCDTEKFASDVNAAGLCGARDWRMPSANELEGIADLGRSMPSIDPSYFPNTRAWRYWSATPAATPLQQDRWAFDFSVGYPFHVTYTVNHLARLVRDGGSLP
jgi:hypothetical protein